MVTKVGGIAHFGKKRGAKKRKKHKTVKLKEEDVPEAILP